MLIYHMPTVQYTVYNVQCTCIPVYHIPTVPYTYLYTHVCIHSKLINNSLMHNSLPVTL